MIENRILTSAEKVAAGLRDDCYEVGVALDGTAVVSVFALDWTNRGSWCDNCTQTCSNAPFIWTRLDMRGQGISSALQAFVMEHAGVDRLYASGLNAERLVLASTFGYLIPKAGSVPEVAFQTGADITKTMNDISLIEEVLNG